MQLTVLKRSGATEPFHREKAIAGVRKACKGRGVHEDDLARLARGRGPAPPGGQPGDRGPRGGPGDPGAPAAPLDEVAYLRFASVYRGFESAADFESEIALLRAERQLQSEHAQPAPTG